MLNIFVGVFKIILDYLLSGSIPLTPSFADGTYF